MEHSFDIDRILIKYIREEDLSPEEVAFLQQWIQAGEGRQEMLKSFRNQDDWMRENLQKMQQTPSSRIWDKFSGRLEQEGYWQPTSDTLAAPVIPMVRPAARRWRYFAAATVVFAIAGGAFWYLQQKSTNHNSSVQPAVARATDAQPGSNRAVLTLSNGQTINLDSTGNGVLASQGNMNVTKLADGQLAYNKASGADQPVAMAYNMLSTPRAGQFSLTLPDSSHVWLNNASSLRYPVSFTGSTREVELTGEAYFEIAKDASHPFRVAVHRGNRTSTVEVLGTSFNIMAYDDEGAERTTLVEGSVRVVNSRASVLLKPEEQSVLDDQGSLKTLHDVNVPEITAWKNGYFHFDHASLETTMRQLARWYDVDVEYVGKVPPQEFMGKIQRNLPISAVLKGLENDGVHFELKGRKLIVQP